MSRSDLVNEASQTGSPPVRALFLAFPDDKKAYEQADDQFMVGEALLVAPVMQKNASSRSVSHESAIALQYLASAVFMASVPSQMNSPLSLSLAPACSVHRRGLLQLFLSPPFTDVSEALPWDPLRSSSLLSA